MGVGMPASLWLDEFGSIVSATFNTQNVYLVGSALREKIWRDVDVRVMLDDEAYASWGFGDPNDTHTDPRWVGLCLAFSSLGRQMTDLPIDFQVQQVSHANEKFGGQGRSALGLLREIRDQKRIG